jgi:two-component system phosphate regulon sensor histidine kinase PhoR
MLAALFRLILIICVALTTAYLALNALGVYASIISGIGVLAIPLLYSYINLVRLRKYVLADSIENMPLPSGYWEEVFFRLQRLVRNLKQQNSFFEQQYSRFIEAFQASSNGVVMLDSQDQIEWCNAISERFFDLNLKRDVLQRVNFLIRRPEFVQYLQRRVFNEPLLLDRMGRDANLTLLVQAFPFGDQRHLLLVQDVTDLHKADAMRRDFVANVSHEMKTPITVLMGFLETIQTLDLDKAQQSQYFETMMSQAQRMKSLVEDLLTLANLEANTLPASLQTIHMPTVMALLKNDAEALSQSHHQFHFEVNAPLNLMGEEREILSAFGNLVTNAIRYTPNGGSVNAQWTVNSEGQGEFSVIDTGPGIASEHLPRLTERFYRVDRSRSRDTGGTGLGLAIVKHIANRHQALLMIESMPGSGSIFTLRFPKERISP